MAWDRDLREVEDFIRSFSRYRGPLSKEDEYALIASANAGSAEAMDTLVRQYARHVLSVAKRYQGRGLALWDLYSEGQIGLMKAVRKFDPDLGNRLSTYATWWIRQSVTRAIADKARLIRLPVHMHEFIKAVQKAERQIRHGRSSCGPGGRRQEKDTPEDPVSDERIVEELRTISGKALWADTSDEKLLAKVRGVRNSLSLRRPASLDTPVDGQEGTSLHDIIEGKVGPDGLEHALTQADRETVAAAMALLNEREQEVIRLRFFEGKTLELVSEKVRNKKTGAKLTRERVRQIEEKALVKLRKALCTWYWSDHRDLPY